MSARSTKSDFACSNWEQKEMYGMYFVGYGSFVSTAGAIGVTLTRRISINGGYQLASHLTVNGTHDHLSLEMSQKGAIAGMEFSI
jgi:hypothetical protein